jgi:tetratricopeptide (TPR) repeat protein
MPSFANLPHKEIRMDDEQLRHLERLRETSLRRLRLLEEQAARSGPRTPPEIIIEIEDLQHALADLEQQLSSARTAEAEAVAAPSVAAPPLNRLLQKQASRAGRLRPLQRPLLWAAGLVALLAGAALALRPPTTPGPAAALSVGIASFDRCPQQSDALQRTLASEFAQATFKRLDALQDAASASAHTDLDLMIWGQCDQAGDQLMLALQILAPPGPPEVSEIGPIAAQTSARDLDYATRLSRALISYVGGDYDAAATSLGTLRQQTENPAQQASIAFLAGNSLLFTERYTDALTAYEGALAVDPLQFQARINRGIAGTNLALQFARSHQPYETMLSNALGDLTSAAASPDKRVAALALINRGIADYWVGEDYPSALADCDAALDYMSDHPLGYLCRAAARYGILYDEFCTPPPNTKLARDDLAKAKELAEAQRRSSVFHDIYFFGAQLAQLQAECDATDADKRAHQQEALSSFQQFLAEERKQRVHLMIDRTMVELAPVQLSPTEQP